MGMAQPELRATDIERDRTGELLREAYADGRLNLEEFNERMDGAMAAKTRGQLASLTRDLIPETDDHGVLAPKRVNANQPKRRLISILGNSKQTGAWDPPNEVDVVAVLGDVLLDLRQANLIDGQLSVEANVILGNVTILVRPGTRVVLDGLDLLSNKEIYLHDEDVPLNGSVVQVHGNLLLSNVKVANNEEDLENPIWRHLKRHHMARLNRYHR